MFWGCAFSGPSCPKRQFFFVVFFVFFCFLFFVFFVFCFFCFLFFFVRATSLGPKPSLFVICFLLFFSFCFLFCLFFFGGFKGQVRWPNGPPHLALNPPYLFIYFVFVFFPFHSLLLIEKPCFSP